MMKYYEHCVQGRGTKVSNQKGPSTPKSTLCCTMLHLYHHLGLAMQRSNDSDALWNPFVGGPHLAIPVSAGTARILFGSVKSVAVQPRFTLNECTVGDSQSTVVPRQSSNTIADKLALYFSIMELV